MKTRVFVAGSGNTIVMNVISTLSGFYDMIECDYNYINPVFIKARIIKYQL